MIIFESFRIFCQKSLQKIDIMPDAPAYPLTLLEAVLNKPSVLTHTTSFWATGSWSITFVVRRDSGILVPGSGV